MASESTSQTVAQPVLTQTQYDLLNIDDDGFVTLMGPDDKMREDLALPESEMGQEIREAFEVGGEVDVTVLSWGDFEEVIMSYRRAK